MIKYKSIGEAIEETSKYVEDRMNGKITSLKTGLKKLDKCTIDGIEWNSTITIGGRPSVGKSAYSDCIVEGAFANNLVDGKPDFLLLDFNWELSSRVMLLRRLSARMRKTYKHIVSADNNVITPGELDEIKNILYKYYGDLPITFCEEPLTVKQFEDAIRSFCEKNPGKKVLVRVDHTLLTRMLASDGSQVQMLMNLLAVANILKKEFPIIFMFLTQINREFEVRQEDGSDGAFPRQGDVYGGDAAAMFSETILLLNKPAKYGIRQYGKRNTEHS